MKLKNLPPDCIADLYKVLSDDKPHLDQHIVFADTDDMKMKKASVTYQPKTRRTLSEEHVAKFMQVFAVNPRSAKFILPRAFEFWPEFYLEIITMLVRKQFHTWAEPERAVVLKALQLGLTSAKKDIAFGATDDKTFEKDNLSVGKLEDELFELDADLALILCEHFNLKK